MSDGRPHDRPLVQMLRVVDFIDCIPGEAPNIGGRPISMITFAHLGEFDQTLALSYEDSKRLATSLLQSLAHHGNQFARHLLDEFPDSERKKQDSDEDEESD